MYVLPISKGGLLEGSAAKYLDCFRGRQLDKEGCLKMRKTQEFSHSCCLV